MIDKNECQYMKNCMNGYKHITSSRILISHEESPDKKGWILHYPLGITRFMCKDNEYNRCGGEFCQWANGEHRCKLFPTIVLDWHGGHCKGVLEIMETTKQQNKKMQIKNEGDTQKMTECKHCKYLREVIDKMEPLCKNCKWFKLLIKHESMNVGECRFNAPAENRVCQYLLPNDLALNSCFPFVLPSEYCGEFECRIKD